MIPTNTAFATQKLTVNRQPAPISDEDRAADKWFAGESNRFEFAVFASSVVGNYEKGATQSLAARIRRSATTVQNYARVGHLWTAIQKAYPTHAEVLREDLQTSHWLPVAGLWAGDLITLDGACSWLRLCLKSKWTVEEFRNQLPTVTGKSEMAKTVKQLEFKISGVMADIDNFFEQPAFDVDPKIYTEFYAALKVVKELAPQVMRRTE